jgi:NADPH-dependent 2,4-dienoyl-CoA reductase/sulfur reductase-like enzyme/rhodanese-related sulfurtransferase
MAKSLKIVIIGGIAAGTCAAVKARRSSEEAEIILYEKYNYVSYSTCGLPYYVSGKITDRNSLIITPVSLLEKRFNLKIRILHEIIRIDPARKKITVRDLQSGKDFTDSYDKLIITTGSKPMSANRDLDGAKNVFHLRTIDDGVNLKNTIDKILAGIEEKREASAMIIGGGFIGLELLDAFYRNGFKVTIVEKANHILPVFDGEIVEYLENYLMDKGIRVLKNSEVKSVKKNDSGDVRSLVISDGEEISADIVIMGIGAKPDAGLAQDCGIKTGDGGAISVNEYMQTNIQDIYAAGDCCECADLFTGKKQTYFLAGIASIQGRIAGYNAAGGKDKFTGANPTSIIKVLDVFIAKTGTSLKRAIESGINAAKIELHALNHGGYYPGARMIHMMLIYNKDNGTIIGFEAIGPDGADKKNDVISVAIKAGMKVWDLMFLNLSYHPETGSAKDSLNIFGMIGENIKKGEQVYMDVEELRQKIASGQKVVILDVRSRGEFDSGHIEGALNIPLDSLRENIGLLDKKSEIVIHCRTSYRSYIAYRILKNSGFDKIYNLNGSYLSWVRKL